jgi:oxygen-independent coproporphyrinogen-3 oxidase
MSGIYIHIPFCKQACNYCNFHFSTSLKYKEDMLTAIGKEMSMQRGYLENTAVETIYWGGGTPSLLSADELLRLWDQLQLNFYRL